MTVAVHPNHIQISLFSHLKQHFGARLELLHCTKATLVHLSHTLEDLVLREKLPAILFTGFQESSHWREETERYRALADVAQQVCIFAGGQLPPEASAKEIHVTLRGDDPLRQEWFLCILSPKFSVVLCGQDREVAVAHEELRQFATIWTFDPLIVNDVLDQCEAVVAHYRPDRAAELRVARANYPPLIPDPAIITSFTWSMIHFEEQLQQSLGRTRDMLAQQLRWQDDLVNLLVHDLRTPLQSVLLSVQLAALTGSLNDEQRELHSVAEAGVKRTSELVQTLLDSTKLEHGQFPIQLQPLQITVLFQYVISEIQTLAHAANIQVQQIVREDVPVVWADRTLLERVLINLIHNAIKFTAGGGQVMLAAGLRPDGTQIELTVRDTGRGIPTHAQEHIFERLAQVNDDDRRHGSGLGLYFCRLAAEAHGGTIRVDSELGHGTTFTLALPRKPKASVIAPL